MLVHKTCLAEVEPIPGIGLYCTHCDRLVGDRELEEYGKQIEPLVFADV